ncbi:MFS general substrate transporter [Massarina eburnea CBS 473.64]|uniref:MFS general substrate transporter n=1 Tax=Massarina eburnea CBS 473.64 TaxID=1395130 RepID=A0A6A6S3R1_9PLEO|nr:MFS general substrate transporter [Massarina eburnea CBS 473.64]
MSSTMTTTEAIELNPLPSVFPNPSASKDTFDRLSETREAAVNHPNVSEDTSTSTSEGRPLSKLQLTMTILQPSLINFFGSFTTGIITVGLPHIASSISLQRSLYLWPSSVYSLTSGAALLIAGSIADIIGARHVEVCGIFLMGIFILACGFSQTGVQLVVFRALQGIALAMHIPASVAIIAGAVPKGRARNIGFGCLGLSQPLGFSFGMVASGIMIERIGWRSGFYLSGGAILVAAVASWLTLPKVKAEAEGLAIGELMKKIGKEIDWIGGTIASSGLSLLSYVLAMVSADLFIIRSATTASLLAVSLVLLIAFPLWMRHREHKELSALVPNSLWVNPRFASICALVALSYGAMNAMEIFSSLYFQEVQNHSALITSLYLLPNLMVGVCINLSVGIFIDRVPAGWLVIGSSILCALSPLMMALVPPEWKYYYVELWAQMFAPLSIDVLYTVGLIIVSDSFPEKTQALAGAVFATVAQFGTSLGVGVCQVVALGVMGSDVGAGGDVVENSVGDVLRGYRASFWTMFAIMVCCVFISIVGLRRTGKVGLKKD